MPRKPPVPAPRAKGQSQAKQGDIRSDEFSDDMPMKQDKMPPPVPPKVYKLVRSVGQALPGMVQSYSLSESDGKSGGQDFTLQNNAEDCIRSLTLQCASQTSSNNGTIISQRIMMLTQQTLHVDSHQLYQRSFSLPAQSSAQSQQDEEPPVPAPRAKGQSQAKQGDIRSDEFSDDMPMKQDKMPPPVPPKVNKIVRSGGQALPGMVQSYSLSESDGKMERGQDFTVQENNAEDCIRSLTLQCASQTSSNNGTIINQRIMMLTQQTLHVDSQQLYQRSFSLLAQSSPQSQQDEEDNEDFMVWWHSEEPWKEYPDTKENDVITFTQKAKNLKNAVKVYDYLLSEHGANLLGHSLQLEEVANSIDKVHKGVKIAGITGGAAGAVGVAAAVGGIILAPLTAGASLAVTAVGVGVAAAGGVTGASAAITNKVHTNMDRKKVETILQEHCTHIEEIEKCVKVIGTNIEGLKKYNLSTLKGVDWTAVKMARMANTLGDSVGVIGAVSKSSGMIQGFSLGMDMYFNKEDSKQLKKGSETKFAKQIRKISKNMQTSLDELMAFKTAINSKDV
ncbi:uncharacterized protein LOC131362033 isoform X2 [Hemibagrus wyckioides]|uniref:uncharacterized protein LOC131362033 isoform X2 n=1 Tax=Hemibagrus wyckioides TaxID=337641 RepID=UPI00266B6A67|nr:uncharacterized protein LOC131362033 isoform X2 [Hemibagrus wyckioides]